MPDLRLQIFGRTVAVHPGSGLPGDVLRRELAVYPRAPRDAEPDLSVIVGAAPTGEILSSNPSVHVERAGGFTARYVVAEVDHVWREGRLRELRVRVNRPGSALWRQAQRAADFQFATREARIGMVMHESALVPGAALDPERVPLHASALEQPDGTMLLLGGTGGVGKTSLCMELGRQPGYRFAADDIAVLDASGHVYPNLAYPKVYAYNLMGDDPLRQSILGGRGVLDRVHWHAHRLRGLDKVRRRVSPDVLYGPPSAGGRAGRYLLLMREARSGIAVEPVEVEKAAALSARVLETELAALLKHASWHAYNARLLGREPRVTPEGLLAGWRQTLAQALSGATCEIARIPRDMEHGAFRREMGAVLRS